MAVIVLGHLASLKYGAQIRVDPFFPAPLPGIPKRNFLEPATVHDIGSPGMKMAGHHRDRPKPPMPILCQDRPAPRGESRNPWNSDQIGAKRPVIYQNRSAIGRQGFQPSRRVPAPRPAPSLPARERIRSEPDFVTACRASLARPFPDLGPLDLGGTETVIVK